ncbi:sensor histidine kinase [Paractinoplanes atraurantiacus]|uniref:histidine kinase n=1 Tax=Paractinoplanes atraurantiacus TaxID=1036182 RepID=A0A285IC85_9ACTN|nr:two-component system, OmpR family, sensor histidine kinase KdpD [Actinoplanes atraurantiacus]
MLSRRRLIGGFAAAVAGVPLITLIAYGTDLALPDVVLILVGAVVAVALLGGLWPALLAALTGFLLLNFYFTAPLHSLHVNSPEGLLALLVFAGVASSVSWVVDLAARRTRQADRAAAEARTLAAVAGGVLTGADPLQGLLDQLKEQFGLESATLLEGGTPVASAGGPVTDGDIAIPVDGSLTLVLRGRVPEPGERQVVRAFAAQAAVALRQQRLAIAAEGDRVRTALLAAVGHDLRTPLASAKASVAGLLSEEVEFDAADRHELLVTADESLDRLAALVSNLLDMSRLQAGTLGMVPADVGLEDVVPRALDELGPAGRRVAVQLPDDLPAVRADPGLLDRVLVNVAGNALRYSPAGRPPTITGQVADGRVELRVIDHGPGIPAADRDRVFLPFQRLGDRDNHTGVGLGLALSRGLTEAMGGTLTPEDTPGGGLTMVLTLPMSPS